MEQSQIREEYARLKNEVLDAEARIEVARAMMKINRRRCEHPDQYTYSAMGEMGVRCPDCGYQT
jgi:hypothetical protein